MPPPRGGGRRLLRGYCKIFNYRIFCLLHGRRRRLSAAILRRYKLQLVSTRMNSFRKKKRVARRWISHFFGASFMAARHAPWRRLLDAGRGQLWRRGPPWRWVWCLRKKKSNKERKVVAMWRSGSKVFHFPLAVVPHASARARKSPSISLICISHLQIKFWKFHVILRLQQLAADVREFWRFLPSDVASEGRRWVGVDKHGSDAWRWRLRLLPAPFALRWRPWNVLLNGPVNLFNVST